VPISAKIVPISAIVPSAT